jgi:hypothetical protein
MEGRVSRLVAIADHLALTFPPYVSSTVVVYLHDNDFDDGSLEPLCALTDSRRTNNPGFLQFLTADCNSSVACSCCTECF